MTTLTLPPCPFCGNAVSIAPFQGNYTRPEEYCVWCPDCDISTSTEGTPTPEAAVASWLSRFTLPVLAWEQGRDAAAVLCEERARQNFEVAARREWQSPAYARLRQGYGEEDMGCAAAIAALTPPADLASGPETQRDTIGENPHRPDGASTSSGERRAPVSPRPEISDARVKRAAKAGWDEWHAQNDHQGKGWPAWEAAHPVQAMEWEEVIRAALTAALNPQETPDAE